MLFMKNIKKFKTIRSATDNSEAIKESVVQAIRSPKQSQNT